MLRNALAILAAAGCAILTLQTSAAAYRAFGGHSAGSHRIQAHRTAFNRPPTNRIAKARVHTASIRWSHVQPSRMSGRRFGHGPPRPQGVASAAAYRGAAIRAGFDVPPPGERRYVPREVVLDVASTMSSESLAALARHHGLTLLESVTVRLTGRTLHRLHVDDGRSVPTLVRALADDARIAAAQPNYLYALQDVGAQRTEPPRASSPQWVVDKLHLDEAHELATGKQVVVAVIDTAIDAAHSCLVGAIRGADTFDAVGDANRAAGNEGRPDKHGTAMAGAIAAHCDLVGVAPRARLLSVRAFAPGTSTEAPALRIVKAIDWAVTHGARVINMSFAGPHDPMLDGPITAAYRKGVVLVAAAGNQGPVSPPQYPAAYPQVIAVTATDADDHLFDHAGRGPHIAVAAPGVDILAPIPDGAIEFVTGTSIAAAHVSGLAALLIERQPSLGPDDIRRILEESAVRLRSNPDRGDVGAGLVDAYQSLRVLGLSAAAGRTMTTH